MLGLIRSFAMPAAARVTDLYVDANAAAGGNGSAGEPFQTIHDAVAAAGTPGSAIHIAEGTYTEPLNITIATNGVQLIGSTMLTRDAGGLATGGTTHAAVVCPAQPVPASGTLFEITGANVGVSGLVLDGGCSPQGGSSTGSMVVIDGASSGADGFVFANNVLAHSGGLIARLASGSITGNYIVNNSTGTYVFGWPAAWTGSRTVEFSGNRVTQNSLVGAIFNGSVDSLRAPAIPASGGTLTVEIAANDFRQNGGDPSVFPGNSPNTGLYFVLNDSLQSDPLQTAQIQASVHDNAFIDNSWYGVAVGQRIEPNKRLTGYAFSGEFDRNAYCGNGLQNAFIDLRHVPTSQGGGTQHFRFGRNTTITINTSNDPLTSGGFDLDDPQLDPDAHDYTNPTEHEPAGTPLGNLVVLNGTDVSNAQRITPGPTSITSCSTIAASSANVWLGLKNSDDIGTNFDLLAEVFKNGSLVGSGTLDSVPGGGSGFNNAVLRSIALPATIGVHANDTLTLQLSVRIAANVSGHRSGTARLWFNDAAADSLLAAIVNGSNAPFHILSGFALGPVPGGARTSLDVLVDKAVGGNPFKPFGQWSVKF